MTLQKRDFQRTEHIRHCSKPGPCRRSLLISILVSILIGFSAVVASAQQKAGVPPTADYTIGAHDVLVVTSYDQRDLSGTFAVEADGTFTFPWLGRVTAGGLTLRQAESMLKDGLITRGLFNTPQITVTVDQYRSQKIFILGEVRKPGVYMLSGAMRLVEALTLADSTLPTAGGEIVIVPTASDTSRAKQAARVSFRDLESGTSAENVLLKAGDTILVPRAREIYVFGHVKTPGSYLLRDKDTTVLQALALAGGVADRGAMGRIHIVRLVNGERRQVKAAPTDLLLPGDTVVVPERFF